jgi:putative transferase (TIGR04331 family)
MTMAQDFRDELASVTNEASNTYDQLIGPVAQMLNGLHNENFSRKYWEILVGPWLRSFSFVYSDRKNGLRSGRYPSDARGIITSISLEVTQNFHDYMKNVETDVWNEKFLATLLGGVSKVIPNVSKIASVARSEQEKSLFRRVTFKSLGFWNRIFGPHQRSVFIATYLPILADIKAQLRMGQVPTSHLQSVTTRSTSTVNKSWRGAVTDDELLGLVRLCIPRSYVEDYQLLRNDSRLKDFSKNPKIIFTGNAFWFDDVFKAYMAAAREAGARLVIGQHGGVFGTAEHSASEDHQLEIADRFISYGWTRVGFESKILQVGNFKTSGLTLNRSPKPTKALVVLTAAPFYPRFATGGPMTESEWRSYVSQQVDFVQRLNDEARSKILLRLKPNAFGVDQVAPWNGVVPKSSMNLGVGSLNGLLSDSELVIVTYEGTTHLDTLLLGIPTVLLLDRAIWPLREEARPLYERLEAAKILFYDSHKAAEHVQTILTTGVGQWWSSESTQAAVRDFCQVFSAPISNVSSEIAATLRPLV